MNTRRISIAAVSYFGLLRRININNMIGLAFAPPLLLLLLPLHVAATATATTTTIAAAVAV